MGIAGTAPAFSVAATTATIVTDVGVLSVASIFYCGWIMFGIMLAYIHLRKDRPQRRRRLRLGGTCFRQELGLLCRLGTAGRLGGLHGFGDDARRPSHPGIVAPDLVEDTIWVAITSAVG